MKNIVIGAVNSTRFLLETMMQLNIDVSYVFSLDDAVSENVSGYYPLHEFAEKHGIPFKKYQKINQAEKSPISPMRDTADRKPAPLKVSIKCICLTKAVSSFASTSSCMEARMRLISSSYLRMKRI